MTQEWWIKMYILIWRPIRYLELIILKMFIFGHVNVIKFQIYFCVPNFIKIGSFLPLYIALGLSCIIKFHLFDVEHVYRRRYDHTKRRRRWNCNRKTRNTFCGTPVSVPLPLPNFWFPTQNFTEIGQSPAELWPKNDYKYGGHPLSWILKKLSLNRNFIMWMRKKLCCCRETARCFKIWCRSDLCRRRYCDFMILPVWLENA